ALAVEEDLALVDRAHRDGLVSRPLEPGGRRQHRVGLGVAAVEQAEGLARVGAPPEAVDARRLVGRLSVAGPGRRGGEGARRALGARPAGAEREEGEREGGRQNASSLHGAEGKNAGSPVRRSAIDAKAYTGLGDAKDSVTEAPLGTSAFGKSDGRVRSK